MNTIARKLAGLGHTSKRTVIVAYDLAAMLLSLWLAFSIRFGEFYVPANKWVVPLAIVAAGLGAIALHLLGIYKVVIRYIDTRVALRIVLGASVVGAIWVILAYLSRVDNLPRSVGFIYFGVLSYLMFFGRLTAAQLLTGDFGRSLNPALAGGARPKETPVAIYGATTAGLALAQALRRHPSYRLRYFIDDSPTLVGRAMGGVPIRSSGDLRRRIENGSVEQIFLAFQSSSRSERMAALAALTGLGVPVMTVPSYDEIMSGRYTISDVRPINVEDLLRRDIVPPIQGLIEEGLKGKAILVTGAGGSIGSEICRQVLQYRPRRLVLLDHSEFALYSIETELQTLRAELGRQVEIVPIIGSLLDQGLIKSALRTHSIDTVFHAAAYKHVPLLELNEVVGVTNNVIGTRILADACLEAGTSRLMMISTDKAVRPTNVMGGSKRCAELYIQALAAQHDGPTSFGIVRFGNVLDSSGSVVQQFRKLIEAGGPITVTHPDITRYFMSIPEATQLVLQANGLAAHGEVFVLDMGEPVRIAELARTMISLSGMTEKTEATPEGDIEITYVGLRPGEKLHEELFIGENVADTIHPQIKMARERSLSLDDISVYLRRLERALQANEASLVRSILSEILELDYPLAA